ncbi:MAG: hypothetical protein K0S60_703 [Evtepia sp.]|nr:hypothetical protein [Evtepia sp.]
MKLKREVYPFRDKQQDRPVCYCSLCQGEIYDFDEASQAPVCALCLKNQKGDREVTMELPA